MLATCQECTSESQPNASRLRLSSLYLATSVTFAIYGPTPRMALELSGCMANAQHLSPLSNAISPHYDVALVILIVIWEVRNGSVEQLPLY